MKTVLLLLLSLLLAAASAHAESIYLKNGTIVHGTIIEEDNKTIVVETHETQRIDKSEIESIRNDREMKKWETVVKLAADVAGRNSFSNVKVSGTNTLHPGDSTVDPGISLTAEEIYYVRPTIGIGGGISYQTTRQEPDSAGHFNFIPIYGLVRVRSTPTGVNNYVYATAQFGYNYFVADKKYAGAGNFEMTNGSYAGIGGGYVFGRIQVEVLYTIDQGRLSGDDYDAQNSHYSISADAAYRKISLSLGVIF
jgi:sRNA-binding regulator protein Hfq